MDLRYPNKVKVPLERMVRAKLIIQSVVGCIDVSSLQPTF